MEFSPLGANHFSTWRLHGFDVCAGLPQKNSRYVTGWEKNKEKRSFSILVMYLSVTLGGFGREIFAYKEGKQKNGGSRNWR